MKRSDIYPPGSEEDAQNLTPHPKFLGLPVLVWALLTVFMIAGVGLYSDVVGFYDFAEDLFEDDHDDHEDDDDYRDNGDHGDEKDYKDHGDKKSDSHD